MSDARAMYQEHVLAHYQQPQNEGALAEVTHRHRSHNPLCGDDFTMELLIQDDVVQDVKFHGTGCAISTAAASLVTEAIKGKTVESIMQMNKDDVLDLLQIPVGPVRLKCALLPLEGIQQATNSEIRNAKHLSS